ncbi:MAG: hypothetical protein V4562_09455 [Pseudomonadota bacterium]
MWKIVVGFIAFAGIALFVLSKGGDIDMGGEKHGAEAQHMEDAKSKGAASAPAALAASASANAASAVAAAAAAASAASAAK